MAHLEIAAVLTAFIIGWIWALARGNAMKIKRIEKQLLNQED